MHVRLTGCCAYHALGEGVCGLLAAAASHGKLATECHSPSLWLPAQVTWNRVNYEHRDGSRLKLNVREVTSDTSV